MQLHAGPTSGHAVGGTIRRRPSNLKSKTTSAKRGIQKQPSRSVAQNRAVDTISAPSVLTDHRVQEEPLLQPGGKVIAPANATSIVVLPGFGNDATDYTVARGGQDPPLCDLLQERGWNVAVPDIRRADWFRIAQSIFRVGYWRGSLTTHPGYTWYLDRVSEAVEKARSESGSDQVHLVAHSAGGWLARAFLADPKYMSAADRASGGHNSVVRSLVTLGTPHAPPSPDTKIHCRTGGALAWVNANFPGAYYAQDGVRYICVAGRVVKGCKMAKRGTPQRFAYESYQQVCGEGQDVEGDTLVPAHVACLKGAVNILLDGVYHSMTGLGAKQDWGEISWYGSDKNIDTWLAHLLDYRP